jgi:hypothetical protein
MLSFRTVITELRYKNKLNCVFNRYVKTIKNSIFDKNEN